MPVTVSFLKENSVSDSNHGCPFSVSLRNSSLILLDGVDDVDLACQNKTAISKKKRLFSQANVDHFNQILLISPTPMRGREGNKRRKYLPSKIKGKVNITSLPYKHGWKLIKFRLVS